MQAFQKVENGSIGKNIYTYTPIEQEVIGILLKEKIIDLQQLDIVTQEYKKKEQDLPSILVLFGFVGNFKMQEILRAKYGVTEVNLNEYVPDVSLLQIVHKNVMMTNHFVPFYAEKDIIKIATSNPKDQKVLQIINLSFATKYKKIELFYTQTDLIKHFISSAYIIAENKLAKSIKNLQDNSSLLEEGKGNTRFEENTIVEFVQSLLEDATLKGASDIHIEPQQKFIRIRYRIDGKLMSAIHIYKKFWNAIVVRIKVISNINIAESRKPQDGRIEMNISGKMVDFRISCQPGIYGEKFVIRILDKTKSLMTLEELGFSDWNYKRIKYTLEKSAGITIVTGPTGSGKTTTLYSMIGYLNNVDTNIMTLEDPVEYTIPMVFQTQVKDGSVFDFASGIRSSMRQDPDILLIGEIRDHATAESAIRASLTGHKVLTTLHTVDAVTTIQRLIDMGIDKYMITGNLDAIIAQRLVRKLCSVCKTTQENFDEIEKAILQKYNYIIRSGHKIYKSVGCQSCRGTGYRGRTTIAEILQITPEIDDAILSSATKHHIISIARKQGFKTMQEDIVHRILCGTISLHEARTSIPML